MFYRMQWLGPKGACADTIFTAKAALEKYAELLGKGAARVEVRDITGISLTRDDLARFAIREKRGA